MIKETETLVKHTRKQRFCDVCASKGVETELKWALACCKATCAYCGKDLCEKCVGHEETTWGDYREVYCKNCWELGNEYRPLIEQHENETSRLYEEWKNKCKNIF